MTDEEPKVVRPFSSGPIWAADKEIQEDCVSSSTNTNFAIVLGQGKPLSRNTEPVIKCSLSSLSKNNKPTRYMAFIITKTNLFLIAIIFTNL